MAKSALVNANKKIAKAVVGGYKAVEGAVVGGYKTVERTVVDGYEAVEDAFVDRFLTEDGESVADAKARLRRSQPHGASADGRDAPDGNQPKH